MKENINFSTFCDRFEQMNRNNNFSYEGKRALFEYLEQFEEDTEQEIELDIIALCCEYKEYESIKDYLQYYSTDEEIASYEDLEDFESAVFQEIANKTTLIKFDSGFIIGAY